MFSPKAGHVDSNFSTNSHEKHNIYESCMDKELEKDDDDSELQMDPHSENSDSESASESNDEEQSEYENPLPPCEYYDGGSELEVDEVIDVFAVDPYLDCEHSSDEEDCEENVNIQNERLSVGENDYHDSGMEISGNEPVSVSSSSDSSDSSSDSEFTEDERFSDTKTKEEDSNHYDINEHYHAYSDQLNTTIVQPRRSLSLPHSPSHYPLLDIENERTSLSFEDADLLSYSFDFRKSADNNFDANAIPNPSFLESDTYVCDTNEDDLSQQDMEIEEPLNNTLITSTNASINHTFENCVEKASNNVPPLLNESFKSEEDFIDVETVSETINNVPVFETVNGMAQLDPDDVENHFKMEYLHHNSELDSTPCENTLKSPKYNGVRLQEAAAELTKNKVRHILMSPPSPKAVAFRSRNDSVHSDHDYCSSNSSQEIAKTKKVKRKYKHESVDSQTNSSRPRSCKNKVVNYNLSSDDEVKLQGRKLRSHKSSKNSSKCKAEPNNTHKSSETKSIACNSSPISESAAETNDNAKQGFKIVIKNKTKVIINSCDNLVSDNIDCKTITKLENVKLDSATKSNDTKSTVNLKTSLQSIYKKDTFTIPKLSQNGVLPIESKVIKTENKPEPVKVFDPINSQASKKVSRFVHLKKLKQEALIKKEEELIKRNIPKVDILNLQPLITDEEILKLTGISPELLPPMISPGRTNNMFEEITMLSIGTGTEACYFKMTEKETSNDAKVYLKFKKLENVIPQNVFDKNNSTKKDEPKMDGRRYENISETLQSVTKNYDMSSSSLFASIQKTVAKATDKPKIPESEDVNSPKQGRKARTIIIKTEHYDVDHGEDRVILHLRKDRRKPEVRTVETQTDNPEPSPDKKVVKKEPSRSPPKNKERQKEQTISNKTEVNAKDVKKQQQITSRENPIGKTKEKSSERHSHTKEKRPESRMIKIEHRTRSKERVSFRRSHSKENRVVRRSNSKKRYPDSRSSSKRSVRRSKSKKRYSDSRLSSKRSVRRSNSKKRHSDSRSSSKRSVRRSNSQKRYSGSRSSSKRSVRRSTSNKRNSESRSSPKHSVRRSKSKKRYSESRSSPKRSARRSNSNKRYKDIHSSSKGKRSRLRSRSRNNRINRHSRSNDRHLTRRSRSRDKRTHRNRSSSHELSTKKRSLSRSRRRSKSNHRSRRRSRSRSRRCRRSRSRSREHRRSKSRIKQRRRTRSRSRKRSRSRSRKRSGSRNCNKSRTSRISSGSHDRRSISCSPKRKSSERSSPAPKKARISCKKSPGKEVIEKTPPVETCAPSPTVSSRKVTTSESSYVTTSSSSSDSSDSTSHSRTPSVSPSHRRSVSMESDMTPIEERRVIFVGKLTPEITVPKLKSIFLKFGPITDAKVHVKENGGRYGFVTFAEPRNAWRALSASQDDLGYPFSLGFGGRRTFCRQRYADLDGLEEEYAEYVGPPIKPKAEPSFDMLLQEMRKKLVQKGNSCDKSDG